MPALTIRNLPDEVHAQMRDRAAASRMSMESFIRQTLAEAVTATAEHKIMEPKVFADASAAFSYAKAPLPVAPARTGLWGALRGSVSVAADCDLTAPAGETWSAET